MKELANFIHRRFVQVSYGDYEGVNETPSMEDLITLKGLAEEAIRAKRISDIDKWNQNGMPLRRDYE